ncbi:MAG: NAD(P)-dependent oxidoreductase [Hoeflea sp.]|uniref:NAD-dependent epimerase/dehydratase family protein n=1 Tax=Hoeflea sp. TaxID=1940281 RepID=UPI001DE2479E|nr:NAD(P)-dependent oxidoreductase [Hoeflea sp.]MBU4531988.1 NAD(P)-dependent oxidoreductase [Alphaproteobacteria bacterium]MBU4546410.1 NAD(P)-dependent oxidoreductase [Alphaproteobacteria bacterium]MBU4549539.1 NAD(P)-dependent oxidoreductase [Alphaproteobacteria bacterium]MBV1722714.1 NAD(P)-dependent oxidoreductase [Hoeflea sp.]MBV1782653.1 NAD(P)-dependent oxidoreductase [Hoeflea sp.]
MRLLVTGAAGKVGRAFIPAFLAESRFADWDVVALCHNRFVEAGDRVSIVSGSISDEAVVAEAMEGVTHVLHLAAVKESPDLVFDVALKGLYLLLEEFRGSAEARQFVLLSGDCVVGHIFQPYDAPITEASARKAYPGCYALTKVLEETMLEQYGDQYGVNWSTLRAPWIMEKDDFRFALDLGKDQFGGPPWTEIVDEDVLESYRKGRHVPVLRDARGNYLKRNFVHVDDLVAAILATIGNPRAEGQLFNIAMDQPIDYGAVGEMLKASEALEPIEIDTPFHSNWFDNSKARMVLGWAPEVGLEQLVDRAWRYEREENDPRVVWYPG